MQKRISECVKERPLCHVDRAHPVHVHGEYERYANVADNRKERVGRFLCRVCRRSFSVLPAERLPYTSLCATKLEAHFDACAAGQPPPPATEKEKGCAQRVWTRFAHRVEALTALLGQMIRVVKPRAATLWRELRQSGSLVAILHLLSQRFHTSLLGDYACLRPWPGGARAD